MVSLLATLALATSFDSRPDPARLRATVEKLATWPTRNTSTPQLTEAANWVADQFRALPGLQVEIFHYKVEKGPRVPEDRDVVEVVATLPGETDHRIVVGGHMDTINLKADPMTGIAPGADDDASGVALTLEVARLMSGRKWHNTLVFVGYSGEEQGLFGSQALAKFAKAQNWKVDAVLNNDIVGSSSNAAGMKDTKEVRLFSEQSDKHNSRELARYAAWLGSERDFKVKLVLRRDRFARGGDQTSWNNEGYSGVRYTEVIEDFTHQHTAFDLPKYVDYNYMANVTNANYKAFWALAQAGDPPTAVKVTRELSHNTTLTWQDGNGPFYVYWRDTANASWEGRRLVGNVHTVTLNGMSKDDMVYAIGGEFGVPVEAK